jgi:hypothetical protein
MTALMLLTTEVIRNMSLSVAMRLSVYSSVHIIDRPIIVGETLAYRKLRKISRNILY